MPVVINGTTGISGVDGSASTPAVQGTDTNTGIFYPAADTIAFAEGGAEAMRIDSDGDVGIGTTSPSSKLHVVGSSLTNTFRITDGSNYTICAGYLGSGNVGLISTLGGSASLALGTDSTERARITSGGDFYIGTTTADPAENNVAGIQMRGVGSIQASVSGGTPVLINRKTNDGNLILFYQDGTNEGSISVSGTTVSYNGGHLSRWAQTTSPKDDTLLKGTVLSNLDEMNVYTDAEGNPVPNEQLNKVKVSDVEGDVNVAGVFVNWSYDEQHQVDEINMAMTGDMIIRIAQGVVVQKGDLLMSAGDGTAKPQGDDIVRSKTVAKVTSNHVTCTYEDGSYCVPCVLMAC
jgi:hypothetical protein